LCSGDGVADLGHRHGLEVDIAVTDIAFVDNIGFGSIEVDCRAGANKTEKGLGQGVGYTVNRNKS
jgi:hypothetical protein